MRVKLIQLPYLAVGSPTQIAVPGVAQVGLGNSPEATCRVEARGELAGDAFVLDEPVLSRQPDGLFVEMFGLEVPPFDSGDLGTDQGRTVCEVLGAVMCP